MDPTLDEWPVDAENAENAENAEWDSGGVLNSDRGECKP